MGAMNAQEMAAAAGEGEVSMRMALNWHLTANHFPPVHTIFVDSAIEAIRLAADEEFDTEIELPNGIVKTVQEICEDLHLWDFVDNADALPPEDADALPPEDAPEMFEVVAELSLGVEL